MGSLLVSSAVFVTVISAMAFGVVLGYGAILGILRLFGHRPQKTQGAPAPALIPATHASGD